MQERKQSRWVMPVILLMLVGPIVWVSATFVVMSGKADALNDGCTKNLEQLSQAFEAFAAKSDGKLPHAARWVDQLQPYLADKEVLHCPADRSGKLSSYAMNSHLSNRRLKDVSSSSQLVLLYETKQPGDNPSGVAEDAVDIGRNTRGRHYRTANRYNYYLGADLKIHRAGTEDELKKLQWDVAAKP